MPSLKMLKCYNLEPFVNVRNAVISGNLLNLTKALDNSQSFFIKAGIYLILEKLKILTYRNLFKKTCLLLGTHQLPIEVGSLFIFLCKQILCVKCVFIRCNNIQTNANQL